MEGSQHPVGEERRQGNCLCCPEESILWRWPLRFIPKRLDITRGNFSSRKFAARKLWGSRAC